MVQIEVFQYLKVFRGDATTIVYNLERFFTMFFQTYLDISCPSIKAIFHQLFDSRWKVQNYLPRANPMNHSPIDRLNNRRTNVVSHLTLVKLNHIASYSLKKLSIHQEHMHSDDNNKKISEISPRIKKETKLDISPRVWVLTLNLITLIFNKQP